MKRITNLGHTHLVRRQRASLIRTDDVRAPKRLDTRKVPDDRVLLCHFLRS